MRYADEASKLDVRALMAKAVRLGRLDRYEAKFPLNEEKLLFPGVVDKPPRNVTFQSRSVGRPIPKRKHRDVCSFVIPVGMAGPRSKCFFFKARPQQSAGGAGE
jgi:hypothetical protein